MMAKAKTTNKRPEDMTEAELAEYFYAHRDDLAGEEVAVRQPERMDVMISTRFSPAEAAKLRAAAAKARMSVSAFVRQQVLMALTTNVIDLQRVRSDLTVMYSKAADALSALEQVGHVGDQPPSGRRQERAGA